jgi:Holliday junction resolvase RusA-like endonuclease
MRYKTQFFVEMLPHLPNVLNKMHWAQKGRYVKDVHQLVGAALAGKKPREPLKKAVLTLARYSSVRPDNDNLTASFKPVIDALIVCGVIEDDNPRVLEQTVYLWEFAKPKSGKIFVRVEERVKESACITHGERENEQHEQ